MAEASAEKVHPAADPGATTAAGLPLPAPSTLRADAGFLARFWSKAARKDAGPNDCWPWAHSVDEKGYGRIRVGVRVLAAHRVALMLHQGRWPAPDLMVLHSCDNPRCVNPAHLREGTAQENQDDITARGRRHRRRPGADHWKGGRPAEAILRGPSALTPWHVAEARRLVAEAGGAQAARKEGALLLFALESGVSEDRLADAAAGRTFAWVPGSSSILSPAEKVEKEDSAYVAA